MARAMGPRALLRLAAIAAAGATAGPVRGQELHVDLGAERSVRFISRASIEEFAGVTDGIDGYVLLDGAPLSLRTRVSETELYLEVDLASLDTGIGLRNRHMRDNYLEVDDHPYAFYEGRVVRVEERSGGTFRVTAGGTMSIHGVGRAMELPCDVTPVDEGYRARCAFQVLLSDFDIDIPKVMFLKLANEIRLELDFSVVPPGGSP
jgi:polyisoprenoid-binding protein YceI